MNSVAWAPKTPNQNKTKQKKKKPARARKGLPRRAERAQNRHRKETDLANSTGTPVLKIVIANDLFLFGLLGGQAFQRIASLRAATNTAETLELIKREKPQVVIVPASTSEFDGFTICERVKADPQLSGTRVMLLLDGILPREQLAKLARSQCDDVICSAASADRFYTHVCRFLGLPVQGAPRASVDLFATIKTQDRLVHGRARDLTRNGAKILVSEPIGKHAVHSVALARGRDESVVEVRAKLVWERESNDNRGWVVGLQFMDVTARAKELLEGLCAWSFSEQVDGVLTVALQGDLDEQTELSDLQRNVMLAVEGGLMIEFDLLNLRRINSSGASRWVSFLRAMPPTAHYQFVHAPISFISHVAMVPAVLGTGKVVTFFAPFFCTGCGRSEQCMLESSKIDPAREPPYETCSTCKSPMVFDDFAPRYFSFLRAGL
jgi:CheY-like chemotaxis protein